jgi:hypothetical protein
MPADQRLTRAMNFPELESRLTSDGTESIPAS